MARTVEQRSRAQDLYRTQGKGNIPHLTGAARLIFIILGVVLRSAYNSQVTVRALVVAHNPFVMLSTGELLTFRRHEGYHRRIQSVYPIYRVSN
jgi:hypothetical protein